jgi:predicted membrane-bound mannosyltransferase
MTADSRSHRVAALVVIGAALLLRLVGLDRPPLDPDEASQAAAAWWTATGAELPASSLDPPPVSALLLALDAALFWLAAGVGDGLARVVPALAGVVPVVAAVALRSSRGWGALPLAVLLAVDPWLVAHSRRATGAVLAAAAAVICHLMVRRIASASASSATEEASRRHWLAWSIALGLLVVSGAGAWDFVPPVWRRRP